MKRIIVLATLFVIARPLLPQTSSWEPMNRGLKHLLVYAIEVDPVDSLLMYCGTDYGHFYRSTDGGFNWVLSNAGIPPEYSKERITALFMDRFDRNLLYCGFSGRESTKNLFVSTDGAASWNILPTPNNWKNAGVLHIYKSYGVGGKLFCGIGWYTGLFFLNQANEWVQKLNTFGIQVISGLPSNPAYVYAGTSSGGAFQRSTDGGETWSEVKFSQNQNHLTGVRAMGIVTQDENLVYAGVTGPQAGLYRSTDRGLTWTRLNQVDEISEIAIHPRNRELIYISAIKTGVHRSTDGGQTWVRISGGFPTMDVMRVRIAPGYPVRVFAVTLNHGIFRMVDEELTEEFVMRE